ncbi:MSL complex subunit 3 isoform X2 [Palaemon carinicauda]|uniref:MSL complex subunit 3 isoform X2 n=1 Tax=Palaemon carinicauda TaxID=392227 RepID=UPI0035B5DA5D
MVSTRGVKVKFSEGERVLCYEPDPTKAKVLYDSKVLEVVYNKDNKGRKQVEYLIHFQGWNASWDRCVAEDYVLKDTDENRELQRQLADKAHIKLSIKSNRVLLWGPSYKEKRRKRRLSETIRETIEREKKDQQDESETSSHTGTTITDEDMGSGASEVESNTTGLEEEDGDEEEEVEEDETSDEETFEKHFPIVIPENLKAVLEQDYYFINEKDKILDLPTPRTALSLLESYVRFFAVRYIPRTKERRRSEMKERDKTFLTLDLCKEVMDGIRICFDFHIETHLLYSKELKQAEKLRTAKPIIVMGELEMTQDLLLQVEERDNEGTLSNREEMETEEIKPKPEKGSKEDEKIKGNEGSGRRQLRSKRPLSGESSSTVEKDKNSSGLAPPQTCESGRSTPTTITSGTSTAGISGLGGTDISCVSLYEQVQPQLQDWSLLPETHRDPPPPSLLYGPHHLIRLFVKLPEILYRMNLPEIKKKIILKHLELFLEYVSNHSEDLFQESHYITNPYL